LSTQRAEFPGKLKPLFKPARYKVIYGGRGGAKSWGIARALLIMGVNNPIRVLCAREFQSSISDSVHKLLSDQIYAMGLAHHYEIEKLTIKGANGTEFRFAGIRTNVNQIRSFEGVDICWVEEAANVSKASWEVMKPTIRKDGSEIWISFNPELDTDETYKQFVLMPPRDSIVIKMNWQDNAWFPDVLEKERTELLERDPVSYLTVWEGHCRQTLDGAIYANEIMRATQENRITAVPYEPAQPVHTFWDLGRADMTSIWFAQRVGFQTRIIDSYEANGHALGHFLKHLQSKPYVYGTMWLPHDATHKVLGAELTIEKQARAAGFTVRIVPNTSIVNGINAARTAFDNFWFDEQKCADGIQALRRYQYGVNDQGQRTKEPLHNEYSHFADALRYLALGLREQSAPKIKDYQPQMVLQGYPMQGGGMGWAT
jgi:phage terminase large subunit